MVSEPFLIDAKIHHKRFSPKTNEFFYRLGYLAIPSSLFRTGHKYLRLNQKGLVALHEKDYGERDSKAVEWVENILKENGLTHLVKDIILITMPRVLGYSFNPVSFWFARDAEKNTRAVLCEVHNTFGEIHSYLCYHQDKRPIDAKDKMETQKNFHVSPFFEREGSYRFTFSLTEKRCCILIDYFNQEGKRALSTSVRGTCDPLTNSAMYMFLRRYPAVTFKTIILIHWQAIRLILKGVKHLSKPKPKKTRLTISQDIHS